MHIFPGVKDGGKEKNQHLVILALRNTVSRFDAREMGKCIFVEKGGTLHLAPLHRTGLFGTHVVVVLSHQPIPLTSWKVPGQVDGRGATSNLFSGQPNFLIL